MAELQRQMSCEEQKIIERKGYIKQKVRAIGEMSHILNNKIQKQHNILRENVVINDHKIDEKQLVQHRSKVSNRRKNFKVAKTLDSINELTPHRIAESGTETIKQYEQEAAHKLEQISEQSNHHNEEDDSVSTDSDLSESPSQI
jgi:hypothetical protein